MLGNDEKTIRQEMKAMAAEVSCDGESWLRLDRATLR